MSLKDILKYQEEDKNLYSLDTELQKSKSYQIYKNSSTEKVKNQEDIKLFVRNVQELYNQVENYVKGIEGSSKEIADIAETVGEFEEMREVDLYEKKIAVLQKYIESAERDINRIKKEIEEIDAKSRATLMMIKKNNDDIVKSKAECDTMVAEQNVKRQEITRVLKPLAENITPELLAKYKEIRKRGKLPVIVPVDGMSCIGCHMEVDRYIVDKIGDGLSECPNCGRLIYKA